MAPVGAPGRRERWAVRVWLRAAARVLRLDDLLLPLLPSESSRDPEARVRLRVVLHGTGEGEAAATCEVRGGQEPELAGWR